MKIPLTNLCNNRRTIYLFSRNSNGQLDIQEDSSFFPYFYEIDNTIKAKYKSIDGNMLRKVYCSEPADVPKMRSLSSYSADILFTTNYMINRVDTILPTKLKVLFIDIEILAEEIPETTTAKYPVSCISVYNSFTEDIITFFLPEQQGTTQEAKERALLDSFVKYIKKEQPDMILAWNIKFDYEYLSNRIKNFAKLISPIGLSRRGDSEHIFFPCGISILDYLNLFRKVYMREASYTLDYIAQKYLGKGKEYKNVDFSKLDETIKNRNIGDVQIMVDLENKFKLIPYYDKIRRLTKCQWEDLYFNSRLMEFLLLSEAKDKNLVLPNKPRREDTENVSDEAAFQGATRGIEQTGLFKEVAKLDLTSAYPSMIVNFSLDAQNINTKEGIDINGIKFKQNSEALLPTIVKKILALKDEYKKLTKTNPNEENKIAYAAIKAVANSAFGVCGSPYFRLFNLDVASTITFLVRDLMIYVKERLDKIGLKVLYWDTDAVFVNTKENLVDKLNQYIKDWAKEKYNKDEIDLKFEYEGYFNRILFLGSCHYYGYLEGKKNPEIKGVEVKRASSSKFEAQFQEALINHILNEEKQEDILNWIDEQKERLRESRIEDIAFPCKITNKEYKNYPINAKANDNTKRLKKDFKVRVGELFYYIFTKDSNEVLAFTEDDNDFIKHENIDFDRLIERNITAKSKKIFECLGWTLPSNTRQMQLI